MPRDPHPPHHHRSTDPSADDPVIRPEMAPSARPIPPALLDRSAAAADTVAATIDAVRRASRDLEATVDAVRRNR